MDIFLENGIHFNTDDRLPEDFQINDWIFVYFDCFNCLRAAVKYPEFEKKNG